MVRFLDKDSIANRCAVNARQIFRFSCLLVAAALVGLSNSAQSSTVSHDSAKHVKRPSFVVFVVDDMRFDEYAAAGHPYLDTPNIDRLAQEGATFSQAYHASPLCSPNRATLVTGQYPSRHGILDNTSRSFASHQLELFPEVLQQAGYRTAHIGKWHMGNDASPRPGYDEWISFPGQGRSMNPVLFENGRLHEVEGYLTDLLTDRAVGFIREHGEGQAPLFLFLAHKAVHPDLIQLDDGSADVEAGSEYVPAPRHIGRYEKQIYPLLQPSPEARHRDLSGKQVLAESLRWKTQPEVLERYGHMITQETSQHEVRRRAEMLLSVDESLGRVLDALEQRGILDETVVILTSDNGYFYGEHSLTLERRYPYQPAVKSPLLVRYPPLVKPGRKIDAFYSSVDLAATTLDLANVDIPESVQGVSQKGVLQETVPEARDSVLVEYYAHENPMFWTAKMDYRAVLKGPYKYIKWLRYDGAEELYNLQEDPNELLDLSSDESHRAVLGRMRAELRKQVLDSMGI